MEAKCGCPLQRLGPDTISVGHQEGCKDTKKVAKKKRGK